MAAHLARKVIWLVFPILHAAPLPFTMKRIPRIPTLQHSRRPAERRQGTKITLLMLVATEYLCAFLPMPEGGNGDAGSSFSSFALVFCSFNAKAKRIITNSGRNRKIFAVETISGLHTGLAADNCWGDNFPERRKILRRTEKMAHYEKTRSRLRKGGRPAEGKTRGSKKPLYSLLK
jgi:hypothetical protein